MRTSHILLLCILGHALFASVFCNIVAGGPGDCCFKYYPRSLNKMLIRSYYMTDDRCPMTAAVLTTMKGATICVDPKLPWVVRVMKSLDQENFYGPTDPSLGSAALSPHNAEPEPAFLPTEGVPTDPSLGSAALSPHNAEPEPAFLPTEGDAGGPGDCCFQYYPRTLNKMYVRSYYMTDYRCPRTAAVLTTMKDVTICVDPKLPWVVRVMKSLDEKNF
ncbi:hypothetical protein OYC64_004620 [Pagothenia borchgrevinki]|uniref:Chemokine interleukin-8-like domain-containing protein n=1 Tax=Pagothenia borchgrevinki TaxID=8213 RepID=A0ABD2G094_PAGBO